MSDQNPTVTFSKKVDGEGRLVIPKEHRKALGMDGRDVIVSFEAQVQHYLDDEEGSA